MANLFTVFSPAHFEQVYLAAWTVNLLTWLNDFSCLKLQVQQACFANFTPAEFRLLFYKIKNFRADYEIMQHEND